MKTPDTDPSPYFYERPWTLTRYRTIRTNVEHMYAFAHRSTVDSTHMKGHTYNTNSSVWGLKLTGGPRVFYFRCGEWWCRNVINKNRWWFWSRGRGVGPVVGVVGGCSVRKSCGCWGYGRGKGRVEDWVNRACSCTVETVLTKSMAVKGESSFCTLFSFRPS